MEQLTVKELCAICMQEIRNGNGDKKIVVSDDNEGNGYHGLFYGLTEIDDNDSYLGSLIYDTQEEQLCNLIILG